MTAPGVLYVAYWGALEPLGRSLVVPAVVRLGRGGTRITLVTFEKSSDLAQEQDVVAMRNLLEENGVRWVSLRYHKHPKIPATAWDILVGVAVSVVEVRRQRLSIVHGRTFIGGLVGLVTAMLTRRLFVYHNEGFYPDEQVDGGVWRRGSLIHRFARTLETRLYDAADAIIVLSRRARTFVSGRPAVSRRGTRVIVVPSVVDLEAFSLPAARPEGPIKLVYMGSIGARYIFREVASFFAAVREVDRDAQLRVLTPAAHDVVASALRDAGVPAAAWSVGQLPHERIPGELPQHSAGLFFLRQGLSEFGCSPTKIGEYWASGLPVVTTPNASDTDEIIEHERVGVIVRGHSEAAYREAAHELIDLLRDERLAERCRRAAERHYSLTSAVRDQLELYAALHRGSPASP